MKGKGIEKSEKGRERGVESMTGEEERRKERRGRK